MLVATPMPTAAGVLIGLVLAPAMLIAVAVPADAQTSGGALTALRLPQGGHDVNLPDTLFNRVQSYRRLLTAWVSRIIP
jgi:hypothetical protein